MDKNKYMESILRRLLWIYNEKHSMYIDFGYRFEGYSESQWLGLVLQHAKKALGQPGLIDHTVLPTGKDSVKVRFLEPTTKQTVELPFAHYMQCDEFPLNGIRSLELNVKKDFLESFQKKGEFMLESFSGKKALELIPEATEAISRMENAYASKKELETMHYLLAMAQMRPDSLISLGDNNE